MSGKEEKVENDNDGWTTEAWKVIRYKVEGISKSFIQKVLFST